MPAGIRTKPIGYGVELGSTGKKLQPGVTIRLELATSGFQVRHSNLSGGGRKEGLKTAKMHRNKPKNCKPHLIFSQKPKLQVHRNLPSARLVS